MVQEKTRKRLQIGFAIFFFIYILASIGTIILSFDYWNTSTIEFPEFGAINYVIKNIGKAPILNVTFTNDNCPFGYKQESLGVWPGSESTTPSEIARILKEFYSDEKIPDIPTQNSDDDENDSSDPDIKETKPWEYYIWNDQKLCLRRYEQNEYKYALDGASCDSSTHPKHCGSNLCVKNSYECPITHLEVVTQSQTTSVPNITYQKLEDQKFLKLIRDPESQPIINIEHTLNGFPCFTSPLRWQIQPKPLYSAFDNALVDYGCKHGIDFNTSRIDMKSQYSFYLENGLQQNLYKLTGLYSLIKDEDSYLVGRKRPLIKNSNQCQNYQDFSKFADKIHNQMFVHKEILDLERLILAIAIIQCVSLGCTILCIFLIFKFEFRKDCTGGTLFCMTLLNCSILVMGSIYSTELKDQLSNLFSMDLSQLFTMIDLNCFSQQELTNALQGYQKLHIDLESLDSKLLLFSICYIGGFISYFISQFFIYYHAEDDEYSD